MDIFLQLEWLSIVAKQKHNLPKNHEGHDKFKIIAVIVSKEKKMGQGGAFGPLFPKNTSFIPLKWHPHFDAFFGADLDGGLGFSQVPWIFGKLILFI